MPLPGTEISLKPAGSSERGLESAERSGSPGGQGAILVELAITAFRAGDVEPVRELLPRARAAAATRGDPYHLARRSACRPGSPGATNGWTKHLRLVLEALELWHPHPEFYPYCLALWPLAGAYLAAGQNEQAIAAARRLLDPDASAAARRARGGCVGCV